MAASRGRPPARSPRTGGRPTPRRAEHLVVATYLAGIRPVDVPHIRLRPAIRSAWTADPLPDELERFARCAEVAFRRWTFPAPDVAPATASGGFDLAPASSE